VRVKCNNCRTETSNQPEGDGCHACLKGRMVAIDDAGMTEDDRMEFESYGFGGEGEYE